MESSVPAGDETTYPPLAHLPRSISRQRSLQKGKSASPAFAGFLQIGQRSLMERLPAIGDYKTESQNASEELVVILTSAI